LNNLAIVVLAAGQSSRLGQPKQLVEIENKTLIERQCLLALSISSDVFCVLGFEAESIKKRIQHLPISTVINSKWQQGMASSISAGVSELPEHIKHVMVLLVDQWQLDHTTLSEITEQTMLKVDVIHTCTSEKVNLDDKQRIGPPTVFPQAYFPELIAMDDNKGAKALVMKYFKYVNVMPFPQAFIDLDEPKDLIRLRQIYPN